MNLLRFRDLKARGIASSWSRVRLLQQTEGFPLGIKIGAKATGFVEDEVDAWVRARPRQKTAAPSN